MKKSAENYYWGMKQASYRIAKEETIRAFWKGHVPAQVLSGTYGLTQVR
jgi:solute carrier family 25 thiamine pyrophosphate transporter 19